MKKLGNILKLAFLIVGLALYLTLMLSYFSSADPQGADVTNLSTETYTVTPESRTDDGATITTITLDVIQQEAAWKAYVGNITGTLVLRDADGWSIYEWAINSSLLSGNVFVSRNDSINWTALACVTNAIVTSEQTFHGMSSSDTYSINNTFNYSIHKEMNGSIPTIAGSSCQSTATYVNGSAQTVTASAYFQEILLTDNVNLIYGTFVDQNAWGFDNNESVNGTNVTYDFQLIVAENRSASTGTTYYFYADIA